MSRSADIRMILKDAPSTSHEIAALLGISLRSVHVGLWVLQRQRHVRKTGTVVPIPLESNPRGPKTRKLFELTPHGRRHAGKLALAALAVLAILLTGCTPENMQLEHTEASIGKAMVLHAKGIPCPPGYTLVKGFFTEQDGSTQDAYVNKEKWQAGQMWIDYLAAGESVRMLLPPPPERKSIEIAVPESQLEKI